jgi:hypothetical protein
VGATRGDAAVAVLREEYAESMSPIPGERLTPKPAELTTSDGRKFKIKVPGLTPPPKPEERGSAEPRRDDPEPPAKSR